MKIKEIIVVEGKHDSEKLKSFFDCETIETNGTHISTFQIHLLKKLQQERGLIIFTDPDSPGNKIRHLINTHVEGCKNAFIDKNKAKTKKKVGIEHANKEDLEESLKHLLTYQKEIKESLSFEDFIDLQLTGSTDSTKRREYIGNQLFLGKANAKTLFKRLNMLGLTKSYLKELLENGGYL